MQLRSTLLVVAGALSTLHFTSANDKELFNRVDKDGDGVISQNEVEGQGKPLFARLLRIADKNRDGKLTKEEFEAGLKPGAEKFEMSAGAMMPGGTPGGRPGSDMPNLEQVLARIDTDKNGKISESEAPPRIKGNFKQLDRNGDGELDRREMGAAMMMARPGAGAPGNPQRPGSDKPKQTDRAKKKKE